MSYTFIDAPAHGFSAGAKVTLSNLDGGAGLIENYPYYVLAAGLTANILQLSLTNGGAAVAFDTPITAGSINPDPTYVAETTGIMAPPTAPAAPASCVLTSAVVVAPDGTAMTRLDITIVQSTSSNLLNTVVTITGGSNAVKVIIPKGQTTGSIASVVPGTAYTGTAISYDTFGNASSGTASAAHTAAGDLTAPSVPTGLAASGAILGIVASWTGVSETDLSHYELAISTDAGVSFPTVVKTKSTLISVGELAAGVKTIKVRAVDLSGNASAYTATATATARVTDLVTNSGATVTIDSSGITITNGKLTIKDEFNTSVIGASGFSSDWVDYISLGLYNGRFLSGVAGVITNGRSAKLPYWTVADSVGAAVATFVANGGVQVKFSALSDMKSFTSDAVPVGVNVPLHPTFTVSTHQGGGVLFLILQAYVDWFAWDMTPISTTTLAATSYSTSLSNTLVNVLEVIRAPALAFYAKLRFTVEESSIGTHHALNSLTVLAAGLKEVPAYQFNGTAFPSSPSTNDKFFRTDLGMEFYWDGTRWLSTELFKTQLMGWTANLAATTSNAYFAAAPDTQGGSDVWLVSALTRFFVVSGGTALGASHKWVSTIGMVDATAGGATVNTVAATNVDSGSSNVWRGALTTIGALMGSRYKVVQTWTKTGTPGALQAFSELHYRIVAT